MMKGNNMSNQIVFSGQPYYAVKKLSELRRRGYKVIRSKTWADGSTTYVMQKDAA
jgi:hypothetical protein